MDATMFSQNLKPTNKQNIQLKNNDIKQDSFIKHETHNNNSPCSINVVFSSSGYIEVPQGNNADEKFGWDH